MSELQLGVPLEKSNLNELSDGIFSQSRSIFEQKSIYKPLHGIMKIFILY